ncbi:hypothetical protein [Pengzhenrongella sicca]|uniref:Uncharacterized protein n=1 Tax=Pengzhenrongella sicca TaxID=2819238 RepID=A0A8A4ZEL5_9MICO|nr:hypothetical protein [Pengzhenrongella sicca]QTE30344.1 hypothetical protein J4E96_04915 [Pengzhenrongella sicca]
MVALVAGGFVAPAQALGGTCSAWPEKTVVNGAPDSWRTGARCSALNGDTKAQGNGVVSLYADHNTAWFTQLNVSKYSSWGVGAIDSLSVNYAFR